VVHSLLETPPEVRVVTKGVRFDKDQNSAFDETGLAVELRRLGVERLFVGGLAQDVCVRDSVLDALRCGFVVCVIEDGTRPVEARDGERALAEMRDSGARIESTG
jgi:nicotinamidase/pyrazinamidase